MFFQERKSYVCPINKKKKKEKKKKSYVCQRLTKKEDSG